MACSHNDYFQGNVQNTSPVHCHTFHKTGEHVQKQYGPFMLLDFLTSDMKS